MSQRLPSNLEILYATYGQGAIDGILGGEEFEVDGVEFVCRYMPGSSAERFYLVKQMSHVEEYRVLCERFRGGRILELGIAEGGSAALISLLAEPEKYVAIDLESEPLAALTEFIEARGLEERVRPYYSVDQADKDRLHEIVADEFEGALDWVIDDASHVHDLTRRSFEILFPLLRPGGLYVIEDWDSAIAMRDSVARKLRDPESPGHAETKAAIREARAKKRADDTPPPPPQTPLARLGLELVLACASLGGAVAEVRMNGAFIAVTRGDEPLDADDFSLGDIYTDYFGLLTAP